jgi:hypothetical protein
MSYSALGQVLKLGAFVSGVYIGGKTLESYRAQEAAGTLFPNSGGHHHSVHETSVLDAVPTMPAIAASTAAAPAAKVE